MIYIARTIFFEIVLSFRFEINYDLSFQNQNLIICRNIDILRIVEIVSIVLHSI